jgi:hypothetical protein
MSINNAIHVINGDVPQYVWNAPIPHVMQYVDDDYVSQYYVD